MVADVFAIINKNEVNCMQFFCLGVIAKKNFKRHANKVSIRKQRLKIAKEIM